MDFTKAVETGFAKYVNFEDRTSRSEFWWWILFLFIVVLIANMLDARIYGEREALFTGVLNLILFLPNLAISVRRLHDLDKSGWWVLINLIPIIGFLIYIFWAVQKGTNGPNRFGPDPVKEDTA